MNLNYNPNFEPGNAEKIIEFMNLAGYALLEYRC